MTETFATSLGRLTIVHILRAQAEEELKIRQKVKKTEDATGENSKAEPVTVLVQSSVLDILEEATAAFIFEIGKCAQHYSLFSGYSQSSVLDVMDALREFSVLFYVTPRDLLLYMSLEEILIPQMPSFFAKRNRKTTISSSKSTLRDRAEETVTENRHLCCLESWMPPIPHPSTLVLKQGKVVEEGGRGAMKSKGTGQLYAGIHYGLLALAKGASLQENPFLRLPHKAKDHE
ncbi:hypothetical protein Gasu2_16180 [Galdieria sulphuraria]|uniref:Uncharacterized protein n=1 Tax=Galdieria sulphuraria TaxID=130081 RepID=M2X4L9_GALSU|nr:uncharacterized protein Gasu_13340 [Galdieria sulphuraria]EME31370.1 hypothetical protein Gasu_13340 [Galdieria sulphuraria]GJD07250.1 hypothetical protein Gasu2_16180 [Galdieria sulphuraria]|eukprot:XP_005707890.1 hypothetical protein Gasu_13340 [Galdieria sulphuraria]